MRGILYVVSTPIGNLGDITFRAIDVLKNVDVIASEDTRVTTKLLNHFNIKKRCVSYHNNNELYRAKDLVDILIDGQSIALVSDAGTPCISDPGYRLVNLSHQNNIEVVSIPGPSAVIAALSISGLPTDRFYYEGFLPKKKGRRTRLNSISDMDCTVVIYESPMRIIKTLSDLLIHMGSERIVSICREITKKFEEVFIGNIQESINHFTSFKPKGEFVIIVSKNKYIYK